MAIETVNPATGERVRTFQALTDREIEDKLAAADRAAKRWRHTPIAERARIVGRAGELLEERKADYGRLMTLEMGKTYTSAVDEAAKCATACRFYAENAARLLADQPGENALGDGYVAFEPLGVVLAVMPWNFPFWQVIRFAAPALAAGNVGLLKHSSNVPQCSLALEQLFVDAGAGAGVFQSLLIGPEPVARIIADDRVAAATLTGSEGAGVSVATAAGKSLKKTVLELGGSDAFIVMPSAQLGAAVTTAVTARAINNGQSCIAAKRFIVAESIADQFTMQFVDRMRALVVGDPMDAKTQVGPLATAKIRDDLQRQVEQSVAAGAKLLAGGKPRAGAGYYYDVTVLGDVPPSAPAWREETFGPVAAVVRARDAEHAIELANDSRFGLGAAAWTSDAREIELFSRGLAAGTVAINGMVASDTRFPFGGIKKSGYGRELGVFGIREFVNIKTVRLAKSELRPGGGDEQ
jgi:succinate-semialdehyde dehydrogenase/glutarate-semialdehyde dehydrogenase